MIEEPRKPRLEGDAMVIETQSTTEVYDLKYLVAALLVYVAKGEGGISGQETAKMIELLNDQFDLPSSASLELLTNAMEDLAENPDFDGLLTDLSPLLEAPDRESVAVMMLKVVAADGRKDAEELDKFRRAASLAGIGDETLHRAYDRYFAETQA